MTIKINDGHPATADGRKALTFDEARSRQPVRPGPAMGGSERAREILARARPAPDRPPEEADEPPPPPMFTSWEDFLAGTTPAERRGWCAKKAKKANGPRLMSGIPTTTISADVWAVLVSARGRCAHCGSLAVENRPSKPNGAPAPWAAVGRRIGSLGHLLSRFGGAPTPWTTSSGLAFGATPGQVSGGARRRITADFPLGRIRRIWLSAAAGVDLPSRS